MTLYVGYWGSTHFVSIVNYWLAPLYPYIMHSKPCKKTGMKESRVFFFLLFLSQWRSQDFSLGSTEVAYKYKLCPNFPQTKS